MLGLSEQEISNYDFQVNNLVRPNSLAFLAGMITALFQKKRKSA